MRIHHFAIAGLLIVVMAAGLFVAFQTRAASVKMTLTPSTGSYAKGTTFEVDVLLDTDGKAIDGVDLRYLRFEPTALEVVDSDVSRSGVQIMPGSLMPNTVANTVNNTNGTIAFSQIPNGGSQFTGSGVLATITFKVISDGLSEVAFDFTPGSTTDTNVAADGGQDVLNAVTNASYSLGDATSADFKGEIKGKITAGSLSGTSLSDVQVALSYGGFKVSTDETGAYRFYNLPAGTYAITISKNGYVSYTHNNVLLTSNTDSKVVNLYLRTADGSVSENNPSTNPNTSAENPDNIPWVQTITNASLYQQLRGKIVLTVEQNGEAYYIHPIEQKMYYLGRPRQAFAIMRDLGVGITSSELMRIPLQISNISGADFDADGLPDQFEDAIGTNKWTVDTDGDTYGDLTEVQQGYSPLEAFVRSGVDVSFARRHLGTIFLDVQRHGEAWYVYPTDSNRYFLGWPHDAFAIMRTLGLGISDVDFRSLK